MWFSAVSPVGNHSIVSTRVMSIVVTTSHRWRLFVGVTTSVAAPMKGAAGERPQWPDSGIVGLSHRPFRAMAFF